MDNIKKLTTKDMQTIINDIFGINMQTKCSNNAIAFSLTDDGFLNFLVKNEFMIMSFQNTDKEVNTCKFLISGRHLTYKVDFDSNREQLIKDLKLLSKISKLLLKESEGVNNECKC